MPLNTRRIGRAALWIGLVLVLAGAVLDVIAGSWLDLAIAGALLGLCSAALVGGRTRAGN